MAKAKGRRSPGARKSALRRREQPAGPALLKERDEYAAAAGTRRVTEESAPPPIAQFHAQLATLEERVPTGEDWIVEPKFDGYRIISRLDRGKVELMSRNGHDWTERFERVAEAVAKLPVAS